VKRAELSSKKNAYSCAFQRTNVAALDKQQANGLLILARATGGMDQQIDIALAPWRVPFACFGLSRVRFAGFCVPVGWLRLRKEWFCRQAIGVVFTRWKCFLAPAIKKPRFCVVKTQKRGF
jgi:hypothetical protein